MVLYKISIQYFVCLIHFCTCQSWQVLLSGLQLNSFPNQTIKPLLLSTSWSRFFTVLLTCHQILGRWKHSLTGRLNLSEWNLFYSVMISNAILLNYFWLRFLKSQKFSTHRLTLKNPKLCSRITSQIVIWLMERIGKEEILISISSKLSIAWLDLNELHWQHSLFTIPVKISRVLQKILIFRCYINILETAPCVTDLINNLILVKWMWMEWKIINLFFNHWKSILCEE